MLAEKNDNCISMKGDWKGVGSRENRKVSLDRRRKAYANEWKGTAPNSITLWRRGLKTSPSVSTDLLGSLSATLQSAAKDDSLGDLFGH